MYRNCQWKKCCCCNNNDNNLLEDVCDNVENINCANNNFEECACGFDEEISPFTDYPMYGHAYVPIQRMNKTFTPCVGLKMGTIFPELVSPYEANQSVNEIEFLRNANEIKEGSNSGCI